MLKFTVSADRAPCKIKIIGVGGGGNNAVNHMFAVGIEGVEFIAVNTDAQDLKHCKVPQKIQIGEKLTQGLGVGGDPVKGKQAAEEDKQLLREIVQDAHMVFVTGGFGGGTGTGGVPVVCELARENGVLTVAVVTKPFEFEGKPREENALLGLQQLEGKYDTLICIPNQRLYSVVDEKTSFLDAFRCVDDVLCRAVQSISSIITTHGVINRDFNDVKAVMANAGRALLGMGSARGEDRALEAARNAVNSPLLENVSIEGAGAVLVNIMANETASLKEVGEIMSFIKGTISPKANIFYGHVVDNQLKDEIKVTVIATGFPAEVSRRIRETRLEKPIGKTAEFPEELAIPTYLRKKEKG